VIEREARKLVDEVAARGGAARAIEAGYFQEAIARAAYVQQKALENGEQVVVGVNRFEDDSGPVDIPSPDFTALAAQQRDRVREARARRDARCWQAAVSQLAAAASGPEPLMPFIIQAVRARATVGEIGDTLRQVWGVFRPKV
jgi:methylmalonyl-CoA mutase N-terminal domain/subunit